MYADLKALFEGNGLIMLIVGLVIGGLPLFNGKTIIQLLLGLIPQPESSRTIERARRLAADDAERKARAQLAQARFEQTKAALPDGLSNDEIFRASGLHGGILDIIKTFLPNVSPILLIGGAIVVFLLFSGSFSGCT